MIHTMQQQSPFIEKFEWGKIWLEGRERPFKDAKLYPGGAREWDWNETGTRHTPGIQVADTKEILANRAQCIILSTGFYEQLKVPADTLHYLEKLGIDVKVAQTAEAVECYNQLVKAGYAIGGLFHSTC